MGSSYSTSGTWRFDNVTFSAVPEPEEYAAISALALVGWGLWRRRRHHPSPLPPISHHKND
ncbi:MAG: PEP-CTERM sorting domain-containing protein [Proteobacteria bacterium]|nr:PEP-CTERM sorting domain-containing protein [Pseudomonadota bacterium]